MNIGDIVSWRDANKKKCLGRCISIDAYKVKGKDYVGYYIDYLIPISNVRVFWVKGEREYKVEYGKKEILTSDKKEVKFVL